MSQDAPSGQTTTKVPAQSPTAPSDLFPDTSVEVAEKASAAGDDQRVRDELGKKIQSELEMSRVDASQQYEQVVVWRRMSIGLGIAVGLLVAGSGTTALFDKTGAAVIALLASFGTGSLATLNAGQRKTQALTAACSYEEIETSARELLELELPYLPLAEAIRRAQLLTTHRLLVNRSVEPPSTRALVRSNRHQAELIKFGRGLSFAERSKVINWVKAPEEKLHQGQQQEPRPLSTVQ
jgi:hypothetical protein